MARDDGPLRVEGARTGAGAHADTSLPELAVRRRWALLGGITVLLGGGVLLGAVPDSGATVATAVVGAALLNLAAASLLSTGRLAAAQVFVAVIVDVIVAGTATVFFGPGAIGAVLLVLAVAPYGQQPLAVRFTAVGSGVGAFVLSSLAWYATYAEPPASVGSVPAELWLDTAALAATLVALALAAARLNRRMRLVQTALSAAGRGAAAERVSVDGTDGVSEVAAAANALIDRLIALQGMASAAAEETRRAVATLEERMARAQEVARRSAAMVEELGIGLWGQRAAAEDAARGAQSATQEIVAFRAIAEDAASGTGRLAEAAEQSRDSATRIHESATAVALAFRTASAALRDMAGLTERVEALVATVPRLARQTRLLALNAGIEAVRAEEQGGGLSAVADEVRDLALATGDTARSTTELESVLRHATDGLARAIGSAEQEVTALTAAAAESTTAVAGIPAAARVARDMAMAATSLAASQLERWSVFEGRLSELAEAVAGYARALEEGRTAASEQVVAFETLAEVVDHLERAAGRLQAEAAPGGGGGVRPVGRSEP